MNEQDRRRPLMAEIAREQVGRITAEFARRRNIVVTTAHSGDGAAFMFAADHFLVQEDKVHQVQTVLKMKKIIIQEPKPVIPGVTLIRFDSKGPDAPPVLQVVEQLQKELGKGVAAVDHVLTVAPEAGPCPATEPEEVYFEAEPYPAVRTFASGGGNGNASDGDGVRVYVADTGLLDDAKSHPWLVGVSGDPDPNDPPPGDVIKPYAGHGTFVAGVVRCMAPRADVFVSAVFNTAGSALETDFVTDLTDALGRGVDVFNLSVTTASRGYLHLLGFEGWLSLLAQYPDVACVVAAGNDGESGKFWPAAFPGMVSVGALAADWRSRATFSNYGNWVKVYAPGRDLVNAYASGTYECQDLPYTGQIRHFYGMAKWSGTSFSTPMVTGLIAARKSRTGETARQAADSMLADAQAQAIPGVGPILLPYGNQFQI